MASLLLVLPVSMASSPISGVGISTGTSPGVSVHFQNGDEFNFSYSYLLVYADIDTNSLFGMFGHTILLGANLKSVDWHVAIKDGVTYFNSSFPLKLTTIKPVGFNQNLTNFTSRILPGLNISPLAKLSVQVSIAKNIVPAIYAENNTSTGNTAKFTNLTISTLRIDNYITISAIPLDSVVPYNVVLLQSLNATINGSQARFVGFNGHSGNAARNQFNGIALSRSDMLDHASGLLWWPPNYTTNGTVCPLQYSFLKTENALYLAFQYHGMSSGTAIVQDPYLSVVNVTINGLKIINQKIQQAYKLIVDNLELVSTGSIIGVLLVGVAYTSYRRKRF